MTSVVEYSSPREYNLKKAKDLKAGQLVRQVPKGREYLDNKNVLAYCCQTKNIDVDKYGPLHLVFLGSEESEGEMLLLEDVVDDINFIVLDKVKVTEVTS